MTCCGEACFNDVLSVRECVRSGEHVFSTRSPCHGLPQRIVLAVCFYVECPVFILETACPCLGVHVRFVASAPVCLFVSAGACWFAVGARVHACLRACACVCARACARVRWCTSTRKCVQAPVFCIWDCSYVVLRVRVWVFVWRLNVRACVCCFGCRCGCGVSARVGCGSARACARAPARAWACFSTQGVLIWHSLSRLCASESSAWARVAVCMNARAALRVGLRAWRFLRARWSRAQSRIHLLSARVSVFGVLCARARASKCALPAARLLACVFSWACAGLRFVRARGLLVWVACAVAR
jgi:hypothetical protein